MNIPQVGTFPSQLGFTVGTSGLETQHGISVEVDSKSIKRFMRKLKGMTMMLPGNELELHFSLVNSPRSGGKYHCARVVRTSDHQALGVMHINDLPRSTSYIELQPL
jgi:hypothetical protein